MKTVRVRRIDPVTASMAALILYGVFLLLIQSVDFVNAIVRDTPARPGSFPFGFVVLTAFTSSLLTLLACLIYNAVARWTGGVKVTLTEES